MFERFVNAGIAIAGIDAGESYGSPAGNEELVNFVTTHANSDLAHFPSSEVRTNHPGAVGTKAIRELIRDPHFQAGFNLIDPKPGRRVAYGRLPGVAVNVDPAWDLDQWSSRFPLNAGQPQTLRPGVQRWTNSGKTVKRGEPGVAEADLSLAVNAIAEYEKRARKTGEPWVHLLVEQSFADAPALANLASVRLRLKARLLRSDMHRTDDYSPGLHAAQFQLFLMLQNRNRESVGYGKLLWFGIPLYDDRSPFPKEYKQQDTGGTEMFIFTPGGEAFSNRSAHDREWVIVDKELLPLFLEALETAWQRGFLRESRNLVDYGITGMNLGWEVPGLFDVEMQVRDLSLRVGTRNSGKGNRLAKKARRGL